MNALPTTGDLAIVVHDCCGNDVGIIATVNKVTPPVAGMYIECGRCRAEVGEGDAHAMIASSPRWIPLAWLRKIEPLNEDTRIEELETA
jgi:hypothetical protein